jgi:hypothetical protein
MHLIVCKWPVAVIIVLFLFGCASQEAGKTPPPPTSREIISVQDFDITTGQTI